ncbi:MAG: hypothetical protein E6733_01260 [Streptococcus parasanguinis]|nr:hypothetical protein [Streptococcus parasanguinis]
MFNTTLVCNYILAELAHIGMELECEGLHYSVSHCQGDHVSLDQDIYAYQLEKGVDLYIDYLLAHSTDKMEAGLLSRKLKYLLEVYHANASDRIRVTASNYGSCNVDVWNITEDILAESLNDPEQYNVAMDAGGEVLISRLVLKRFWDHEFMGFIEFISDALSSSMCDAYNTLSDISMAQYDLSEYVYKRKINSELCIEITYESDNDRDDMDAYMEDVTLPNGKVLQRRYDEGLKLFYHGATKGQDLPVIVFIKIKDENDCEIFGAASGTYVTKGKGGRYHMADHREIIHEVLSDFRAEMKYTQSAAA